MKPPVLYFGFVIFLILLNTLSKYRLLLLFDSVPGFFVAEPQQTQRTYLWEIGRAHV